MARRTKADALATRNALLDAAERLFEERGVSRTSLQDIAAAAGTTRGAIYWHFQDKADLLNAMMERVTLPLELTHAQISAVPGADSLAQLRNAFLSGLQLIATDDQARRVLQIASRKMELSTELAAVHERCMRVHNECVQQNRQALAQAYAAAQCDPTTDLEAAAIGLQVLIEGLVHQWLANPEAFDLVVTGRITMDVYLNGLGLGEPLRQAQSQPKAPHRVCAEEKSTMAKLCS